MALIERWYKILNVLSTKRDVEATELEAILGVSRQTLKKNIELLNEQLRAVAEIKRDKDQYYLEIINHEQFEIVLEGKLRVESDFNSSKKRQAFILSELILKQSVIQIQDLSDHLNVSRGTVSNDLSHLRQQLVPYNISLIGVTNKGLKIEGDELKLRLLYVNKVSSYLPYQCIKSETISFIHKNKRQLNLTRETVKLLMNVIEIMILRITKTRSLEEDIPNYQNFCEENEIFQFLVEHVETTYHLSLSHYEKQFLSYPSNLYNQGMLFPTQYDEAFLKKLYKDMIDAIRNLFVVDFDECTLYNEIKYHLLFLIHRLLFYYESQDFFLKEINEQYPLAHTFANMGGQAIGKVLNRPVSANEVSYLTLYFALMLNRDRYKSDKFQEIAVVCHTGRGTALMIAQQLRRILGSEIKITNYSEFEYKQADLKQYFAVFTTIPLSGNHDGVAVIPINLLLDESDVLRHWNKIKRQSRFDERHINLSLCPLDNKQDYEENLCRMIDKMALDLDKKQQFKTGILKREELKSTLFQNGIAMPHAIVPGESRVVMAVGQFRETYQHKDGKVDLVFMLGIPENNIEENDQMLIELYDFILSICGNEVMKDTILALESEESLFDLLQTEGML